MKQTVITRIETAITERNTAIDRLTDVICMLQAFNNADEAVLAELKAEAGAAE